MTLEHVRPQSVEEALVALDELDGDGKVLSGGTALVLLLQEGFVAPRSLIEVGRLAPLRGLHEADGTLTIGGATTLFEIETAPLVRQRVPVLAETLARVATVRIRSMATIGGNLAHGDPRLDPAALLLALGASVRLASVDGERRVPLDELFVDELETAIGPTELLLDVDVPLPGAGTRCAYRKLVGQTVDDYGTVNVAVRLELDEAGRRPRSARLVLGGVAPTPIRVSAAEAALSDGPLGTETIAEAAEQARLAADPVDDLRGTADFKRRLVAVEVRRALESMLGETGGRA